MTTTHSDQQLRAKAEEVWHRSWSLYFHPGTNLFYDYLSGNDPDTPLANLPTPEEIAQQYPNPNGWGTGMEDSSISAGVWLSLVCDRFDATGEEFLRETAEKIFAGMVLCATLSPSRGLVLRSVSPVDGKSHYIESSRDQYTWHAYGLWRFCHSPLSSDEQRTCAAEILTAVCARLERNITSGDTDYCICREDGKPGVFDKMWHVAPHEVARLPMLYAIGWDLTGERHWWEMYRRYAWQAARESVQVPSDMHTAYAFLQEQASLEALYEIENEDPELKRAWLEALEFVANRAQDFTEKCRQYRPPDGAAADMNWRNWPLQNVGGYQIPRWPASLLQEEGAWLRQAGEGALAQLMCPRPLPPEQLDLLRQTLAQVDYSKCRSYGLFYPLAAYWRAVKQGIVQL